MIDFSKSEPAPVVDTIEVAKAKAKALEYLSSTNWMALRLTEEGVAIPEDVLAERIKARKIAYPDA